MRQNISEVAHIEPAIAVGALNEVLPLVSRFTTTALIDDLLRHGARTAGRSICFQEERGARMKPPLTPKAASLF